MSRAHRRISRRDDRHPVRSVSRVQLTNVRVMTNEVTVKNTPWDSKPSLEGVPPQFASVERVVAMSIDT